MTRKIKLRKSLLLICIAAVLVVAGCSGGKTGTNTPANTPPSSQPTEVEKPANSEPEKPYKLSIMMPAFNTALPDNNSPVVQAVKEYTNTDLEIQFVPNSSYEDKINITMASGQLPALMVVGKTPTVINAARSGAFWELGPYLKDYPNLGAANEVVLNNTSIDGKIYGIYRARTLGRMGVTLRKDWLEQLGLQPPTTIDEFYNVLKAFTEGDPNNSGKKDTYGIVVSKYAGPWDIMQVWFGAPNKWGEDASGKLVPTHMTPEYMEALRFFKQLYDEGLVNEDFAVMDPAVWTDPIVNGEAGVMVDVADAARRIEDKIQEKTPKDEPYIDVFQAPVGPSGHRDMPTSGYAMMIAVSKSAVKTEEELRRVLTFLDQLNDEEMQTLLTYGVQGRHWDLVNGEAVVKTAGDARLVAEMESMNQMLMFLPENRFPPLPQKPVAKKVEEVWAANVDIVVGNPAEPLISDVYAQKGPQLDNIIADARIKFIVGQIDEKGMQDAIEVWLQSGGTEYIEEINSEYAKIK